MISTSVLHYLNQDCDSSNLVLYIAELASTLLWAISTFALATSLGYEMYMLLFFTAFQAKRKQEEIAPARQLFKKKEGESGKAIRNTAIIFLVVLSIFGALTFLKPETTGDQTRSSGKFFFITITCLIAFFCSLMTFGLVIYPIAMKKFQFFEWQRHKYSVYLLSFVIVATLWGSVLTVWFSATLLILKGSNAEYNLQSPEE
jgi:hypothetical protein